MKFQFSDFGILAIIRLWMGLCFWRNLTLAVVVKRDWASNEAAGEAVVGGWWKKLVVKVGGASFSLPRESAYSLTKPYWV